MNEALLELLKDHVTQEDESGLLKMLHYVEDTDRTDACYRCVQFFPVVEELNQERIRALLVRRYFTGRNVH